MRRQIRSALSSLWLCLLSVAISVSASEAWGQGVVYVDQNSTGPIHDGSGWCEAYLFLQDALTTATSGTTIRVANGTYNPDQGAGQTPGDRNATFPLITGVALEGGYAGCGAPDPDERDIGVHETILSGDLAGDDGPGFVNYDENALQVVNVSSIDATGVIEGFKIKAGNGTGGMVVGGGAPTIRSCEFVENRGAGVLVVCCGAGPVFTNCTFGENYAGSDGGGLYVKQAHASLANCLFRNNFAGDDGGGIIVTSSVGSLDVSNCTFRNNTAGDSGGGIYVTAQASATIVNSILWGNSDVGGFDSSAQVHLQNSTASVSFTCIEGGWSGPGGNNISVDPLFLDADGSDDIDGTEDDDLRLAGSSPGIDAGDNSAVAVVTDLDNNPRIVDGDSDSIEVVDMGAYEFQGPDCNANGNPDHEDIADGSSDDCNFNGVPDECDLRGMVYWTDIGGDSSDGTAAMIKRSQPDGSGIETLVTGLSHPRGMAVDVRGGKMYWGNSPQGNSSIMQSNLDGSDVDVFVAGTAAAGIAVDSVHGKVYWSNSVVIQRASLDGSNVETVVSEGLVHPVGFALDLRQEKLYWTDLKGNSDGTGTINRADFDGSNSEVLVIAQDEANGLAVDALGGKMYWTELVSNTIQRANLDGSGIEVLVDGLDTPTTIALDLRENKMFWTDSRRGQITKIQRANLDGTEVEVIVSGIDFPWGIAFSRSIDCNGNGVPDECDSTNGTSDDCNSNGTPDDCEIQDDASIDCNGNDVPDECDIADETSNDFNDNGIPDECDPDCNENNIPDFLDIALDFSSDCNDDEIPDECQPPVIVSSEPHDGYVDVRQDLSLSGTTRQGVTRIRITFADTVVDATTHEELTSGSFVLVDDSGEQDILEVVTIDDVLYTYEVVFVDPIPPGTWTTLIANVESECGVLAEAETGDRIDIGFLPGDVDSNGMSNAADILALIDSLNEVMPLPLEQTDINRSDVASAADILRVIDLLNGANSTRPWLGTSLPPRP